MGGRREGRKKVRRERGGLCAEGKFFFNQAADGQTAPLAGPARWSRHGGRR